MRLRRTRLDIADSRPVGTVAGDDCVSILWHLRSEPAHNFRNDILHRTTHVHDDWVLVRVGLLQDREVTIEFPYNSIAGRKTLSAEFALQADRNLGFAVPTTLTLSGVPGDTRCTPRRTGTPTQGRAI